MKIRVCIPFYQDFQTCKSGLRELQQFEEIDFVIEPRQGVLIGHTRNSLVNNMGSQEKWQKPLDYDGFLFIDSDIGFHLIDVLRLISNKKDICAGAYSTHWNDTVYEAGLFKKGLPGAIEKRFSSHTNGLKKVDFVGAGFLYCTAKVFEQTPYPWFRHHMIVDGTKQQETGEDFGFCLNTKTSGFDTYCDFDVDLYHKERTAKSFNWDLEETIS